MSNRLALRWLRHEKELQHPHMQKEWYIQLLACVKEMSVASMMQQ